MRLFTRARHRLYRMLGIVSPSGAYTQPRRRGASARFMRGAKHAVPGMTTGLYGAEFWRDNPYVLVGDCAGPDCERSCCGPLVLSRIDPCGKALWAGVAAGPLGCAGDPFDSRPCAPVCGPNSCLPVPSGRDGVNGPQTGGEA